MRSRKGFTIIELIASIAIASIIMVVVYNMFIVGLTGHRIGEESFAQQSEVRYAVEVTNQVIRYATVGFAVTADDFSPAVDGGGNVTGLVKPWSYIGLSPDGTSLVHYRYEGTDDTSGTYEMDVLTEGSVGSTYGINFRKLSNPQDNKLIWYDLSVTRDGRTQNIQTEVEALNAIHVIDWGDASEPAVALAYRTQKTPEITDKPVAALSMVLDVSGSMDDAMNGSSSYTPVDGSNPQRLDLLKNTLIDPTEGIFSTLSEAEAYISIVPFSTNANIPHGNYVGIDSIDEGAFYDVSVDQDTLETMVTKLKAEGGTNTGDGLRRGYYQLVDFETNKTSYGLDSDQEIKKYMVVLVDGVTTLASATIETDSRWWGYLADFDAFIMGDETIGSRIYYYRSAYSSYYGTFENQILPRSVQLTYPEPGTVDRPVGHAAELDTEYGEPYVDAIGSMVQGSGEVERAFVIGYSNKVVDGDYVDLESVKDIAVALGIDVEDSEVAEQFVNNDFVFVASDRDSLNEAFQSIGGYINEELWQVQGPRLTP